MCDAFDGAIKTTTADFYCYNDFYLEFTTPQDRNDTYSHMGNSVKLQLLPHELQLDILDSVATHKDFSSSADREKNHRMVL